MVTPRYANHDLRSIEESASRRPGTRHTCRARKPSTTFAAAGVRSGATWPGRLVITSIRNYVRKVQGEDPRRPGKDRTVPDTILSRNVRLL